MNSTFTCAFFGHRDFNAHHEIEEELEEILEKIIQENYFVEFLVGRNGEFDRFVSSVIRKLQKKSYSQSTYHILVLPYISAEFEKNQEYYFEYYNEVEYCEEAMSAHFKSAIAIRNKYMVDRADLVICYTFKKGGASAAEEYARKQNKNIINLCRNNNSF